jgi:hypothetical protein
MKTVKINRHSASSANPFPDTSNSSSPPNVMQRIKALPKGLNIFLL